jgi:hypothetical protein
MFLWKGGKSKDSSSSFSGKFRTTLNNLYEYCAPYSPPVNTQKHTSSAAEVGSRQPKTSIPPQIKMRRTVGSGVRVIEIEDVSESDSEEETTRKRPRPWEKQEEPNMDAPAIMRVDLDFPDHSVGTGMSYIWEYVDPSVP